MNNKRSWAWVLALAIFTIVYNIAEGIVSLRFGLQEDTLALLGFGVDSFVEVLSGLGILHMLIRLHRQGNTEQDKFEKAALRTTGVAFYILSAGLVLGSVFNIIQGNTPESTLPGLIISIISLLTMWALMAAKLRLGRILNSDAIIADAHCTRTCLYLSVVLLLSSGLYFFWQIPYFDIAGSLGIAWFSFREGRESFDKARGKQCGCSTECHS